MRDLSEARKQTGTGLITVGIVALVILGCAFRLSPILLGRDALFWQFFLDDGYYALAVSRSLAESSLLLAGRDTLTNGFQPLSVVMFAAPFWIFDGDRVAGLTGVLVAQTVLSLLNSLLIPYLLRPIMSATYHRAVTGAFLILWLYCPRLYMAEMSGMETGIYLLTLAYAVNVLVRIHRMRAMSARACILLGMTLGLVFWARNDGVFLTIAFLIVHLCQRPFRMKCVAECFLVGITALVTVSPWLWYNYLLSGNIIPTSGQSEALSAVVGGNVSRVVALVGEMLFPFIKVPVRSLAPWKEVLVIAAPMAGLLTAGAWLCAARWVGRGTQVFAADGHRRVLAIVALFLVFIATFYGAAFGAPWFLERFLAPVQMACVLLLAVAMAVVWVDGTARWRLLVGGFMVMGTAGAVGHQYYTINRVRSLPPFYAAQCRMVETEALQDCRIAALNSGALGFFFEDVVNLDGKVNAAALEARRNGTTVAYVNAESVDAIVDLREAANMLMDEGLSKFFQAVEGGGDGEIMVLVRRADGREGVRRMVGGSGN